MSPTTDLLIIGSFAAMVRGVLPAWREGRYRDVDFVGTPEAVEALLAFYRYEAVQPSPGRLFVTNRFGLAFDISLRGHLIPTVADHSDMMTVEINGREISCLVARPELIFALRDASSELVPVHADKARRDVEGYHEQGIEITPALAQAAAAFRMDR
ncbi:MAG: hypothetical protein DI555_07105 [Novosphingobium pentaromativorans]|uniref:Uncharacterized protein n=1 Tax=Novosphingobium pentaromativorans TaxID=205844 RepID=A0A2W5NTV8_9SPHN|nr:MAG: hypothetical protein DI555_07105 [Novosphingobium pentaromativorans]